VLFFPENAFDRLPNAPVTAEPKLSRPFDWLEDVLARDEPSFDWFGSSQREIMLLAVEREEKLFFLEAVSLLKS